MRITKTVTESGEVTIEIDTEAAPYGVLPTGSDSALKIHEPRLPTHQEYELIRDLLELPHGDQELTDVQMGERPALKKMLSFCVAQGCPGLAFPHEPLAHADISRAPKIRPL